MAIALSPLPAEARESDSDRIDIRASTLPAAIAELSREERVSIGTEGSLPRVRTPSVQGRMSVEQALERLLRNSGYIARRVGERAWRIERRPVRAVPLPAATPPPARTFIAPSPIPPPPIVVTASKREIELAELPLGIAIAQFGEDRPGTSADGSSAVAGLVEGLSLSGIGPGRNRMFLRGVADSAFNGESQSTVAVVLDESRVTYSAPDPDLRLVDVERVELVKGPQGTLYGTGALGGIYRIVTHKPDLDDASIAVAGSGEAVANGALGYSASIAANVPLVAEAAAVRLVGYSGRDGGWIETGERRNSNTTNVLGGRAILGVALGGPWEAELGGAIQLLDSQDSQYVYEPKVRARDAQLAEPHDNDLSHLVARLSGKIGAIRIHGSSGLTWHEVRDTLDATIGADQFGLAGPQTFVDDRQFRVWDSELRASGPLGRGNWLVGISQVEAIQSLAVTLADSNGGSLLIDDDRRTSSDSAIFADVSLPIATGLKLDLGGRLFTSSTTETRSTNVGLVSRSLRKRGVTPAASLAWKPRQDRLIYLRYGSAFRPGGADISGNGTIDPLHSDELATVELGWREELPRGGTFSISAYFSTWENIQSDLLQPDGLLESANVGDGEIFGIEGSADLPLGENWSLSLGATYTSAVLVNDFAGVSLDDTRLPVVPEYTLRGRLAHELSLFGAPARIVAGTRYIGPARLSFDPIADRPMGKVLETDLSARITLAGTDIELAVENLFDSRQNIFAYGNPLRFASGNQYTPQTPLTGRVSIRRRF